MRHHRSLLLVLLTILSFSNCSGQDKKTTKSTKIVGGPCEGCEAIYEYGNKKLSPVDTLPDFQMADFKLKLTGTVYQKDGKTPAKNVILYSYQTNRDGIYPKKGDEKGWAKRHGYLRGWIKTDHTGKYTFYTFRPAAYPNRRAPEHIHVTIKESDKNEYYIDDFYFDDDELLGQKERKGMRNRGGSGIVKPMIVNGTLTVTRDIILGLNIPDYE